MMRKLVLAMFTPAMATQVYVGGTYFDYGKDMPFASAYGGEAMNANFVNCYYKPGPATTKEERIYSIDKVLEEGYAITDMWGKYYIDGNVLTESTRATDDNWTYGVYNQFNSKYSVTTADKEAMRLDEQLDPGEVTTHTAEKAYERIMQFGGASLVRDAVDERIIQDVTTGTATYMDGGNGSVNGIIDTQSAVGGWPHLSTLPAPQDTDSDGMPDDWETENGLDKDDPGDAQLLSLDEEYPNVEVYINSLVDHIVSLQNLEVIDTTGIDTENIGIQDIQMHFNALTNSLDVKHNSKVREIALYSVSGKKILHGNFNDSHITWQLPALQGGIYIVRLVDENKGLFTRKIPVFN